MTYPTWSDLNSDAIVSPAKASSDQKIGPVAVMVSCGPDFKQIRSNLKKPVETPFFHSTLINAQGSDKGICMAGPYIGAPYAALMLESLIAQGAQKVIVLGWCGAVSPKCKVGDLIIPKKAIVDEGTSHHYCKLEDPPCTYPDEQLNEQLADLLESKNLKYRYCDIWTTDAAYRETHQKVAYYRQLGAQAVEMECSALFSVARFRQIPITALLIVSDSVASEKWVPGFKTRAFKQARKQACESVIDLAKKIGDLN